MKKFALYLIVLTAVLPALAQKPAASNTPAAATDDVSATHDELIKLLRLSPGLASFVARDPTLLTEQDYIGRNNPQLAAFLQQHPDVARNAKFYLFSNSSPNGRPEERLVREFWPEEIDARSNPATRDLAPVLVFIAFIIALMWLTKVLLETRRWNRTFNAQTDIYNKMLDKFSSNQELLAYIRSEAGHRFLQSATLPQVSDSRSGGPISRVLTPLQIGVVVTLVGVALLFLRGDIKDLAVLAFGTLAVAVGIGFIISAGLAWLLARHLGMWTPAPADGAQEEPDGGERL